MKTIITLIAVFLMAFIYSSCNDEGNIVNAPERTAGMTESILFTGNASGTYEGTAPGPYIAIGDGSSNLTGPAIGQLTYYIVAPGYIGLGSGTLTSKQTGNSINVVNIRGTYSVTGSTLTYTLYGTIQGGTGKFSKACGTIIYTGESDLVEKTSIMNWTGSLKYMLPFNGNFIGLNVTVPTNGCTLPLIQRKAEGDGTGSHVGACFVKTDHCINFGNGNIPSGNGIIIASNGDEIYLQYTGQAFSPRPDGLVPVTLWATITGGTGRFNGAEGSVTADCLQNMTSGVAEANFNGFIKY